MSFEDKLNNAQNELIESKIWKSSRLWPVPVNGLLGLIGFKRRPPYYNSFLRNFLELFLWYSTMWGLGMWFITWKIKDVSIAGAIGNSVFMGVLMGVFMANYIKHISVKNNLSKWEEL